MAVPCLPIDIANVMHAIALQSLAAPIAHAERPAGAEVIAWAVPVVAGLALIVGYLLGVRRYSRRFGRRWRTTRTVWFTVGAVMLAVGVSPAIDGVAAADPRWHMIQHLLVGMYAPIGLVFGAPVTLLLGTVDSRRATAVTRMLRTPLVHVVGHPATAGLIATAGLYAFYLTPLYAVAQDQTAVHLGLHVHFLFAGYLFTWSIAGPDPAPRRPGLGVRVAVLVAAWGAHAFLAKLLYAHADALPPGSGHEPEQARQAAELMYYGGDIAELVIAAALFTAWLRHRPRVRTVRHGRQRPSPAFSTASTSRDS